MFIDAGRGSLISDSSQPSDSISDAAGPPESLDGIVRAIPRSQYGQSFLCSAVYQ